MNSEEEETREQKFRNASEFRTYAGMMMCMTPSFRLDGTQVESEDEIQAMNSRLEQVLPELQALFKIMPVPPVKPDRSYESCTNQSLEFRSAFREWRKERDKLIAKVLGKFP